ncbi:MAG TPA: hypothetical protein VJ124_18270 [Pyrinomonadaceae bacterium]|nr:hypothetical protein [Pyrinomonadaceae bacterium]
MTYEEEKAELIQQAEAILNQAENADTALKVLRDYNRWYTQAVTLVRFHAKVRLAEFEVKHGENQKILSGKTPDLHNFQVNLIVQIAIIEGSRERHILA